MSADQATVGADFRLFGMGNRRKVIFRAGALQDALTGEVVRRWDGATRISFEPAEYRVSFVRGDGRGVVIGEDESELYVETDGGEREVLSRGRVRLPRFEGLRRAAELRALHGELLTCVGPFGPVPNVVVYPRPWYRDAALMCMAFESTGNLELVEPWIRGISKLHDRNNSGEPEADNLGQLLYLFSLVGAADHPLVAEVLKAAEGFRRGDYLCGRTDYSERPVFQTKWLKYGLRALGLDDSRWKIPPIAESYDRLFWMDYRDQHIPSERFDESLSRDYPYLRWAEAHFLNEPAPKPIDLTRSPLSWETRASDAEYWTTGRLDPALPATRHAAPHSWHAAEMFLFYLDPATPKD